MKVHRTLQSDRSSNDLCYKNEFFRENDVSRLEKISFQIADDDKHEKREDPKHFDSNVEDEKYDYCPNRRSLTIWKLCRIGVLAGTVWTEEKPKTPCHLVVPDVQCGKARIPETIPHMPKGEKQDESQESCNNPKNPLMIVEMIANKLDRQRVADSFNCGVSSKNPSTSTICMEIIKSYGFDHIILIGKCYAGIIFMDCYSRVFEWESMCGVLWFLGDCLNNKPRINRVIWSLEFDGKITEFEEVSPNELTDKPATKVIDVYSVAKKKKKKKSTKNSKNRQY
ncbi:hypothetical protein RhiirC2_794417 [Rhizophagus irregularis]|uniref:Uncharacterized protein n=1 Tax=Rhizophagus irregularis TaxID=588596 RepID=A0A2N1MDM6_9GLOM|nr:hypothetical protein RhiirC2_794417 [Rhizophagus irregularis]